MTYRPPARRDGDDGLGRAPDIVRMPRTLAGGILGPDPWTSTDAGLPAGTADLIGLERSATRIRDIATVLVPGPLQTLDYAWAVIAATTPERLSTREIGTRVRARMRRLEQLLYGPRDGRACVAEWVISEAALLAPYGGPEVLLGQLAHLAVLCERDDVDIRVLPLGSPGTVVQAYTIYDQGPDRRIVYREQVRGSAYTTDLDDLHVHAYAFDRAQAAALTPVASRALIVQRWEDMWEQDRNHSGGSRRTPGTSTASRSPASPGEPE